MTSAESPAGQSAILLRVSVPDQRLDLLAGNAVLASYPISTSKYGLGSEPGSFRTPTGRFVIDEMIGKSAPAWAAFKSRQLTGEIATAGGEEDGILTRILWLAGTEPHNANTRDRFIYIHGTNQEALIGTPASHGCVRMRNADIVDLFARVRPGTPVEILA
jgi:lipoprotein-anchoring transpeptidase ErfK/SrfK